MCSQDLEQLIGLVDRVTYHNQDNGFCVIKIKVSGKKDLVTVVGYIPAVNIGENVECSGVWRQDSKFGLQFQSTILTVSVPASIVGMEKYLSSGLIRGIGPVYAKKLVDKFDIDVLRVIDEEPHRLLEVGGIGKVKAEEIKASWEAGQAIRKLMLFLHEYNVSSSKAVKVFKTYGANSIDIIRKNPYRLARDVRGIGFKSADAIAAAIGISSESMIRARAGVSYALATSMDNGHCGLPRMELVLLAEELLNIPNHLIEQAIDEEMVIGELVAEPLGKENGIFLRGISFAETEIAKKIVQLNRENLPWPDIDTAAAIPWLEKRSGVLLSQSQKTALKKALTSKVLVITGGPGVGKTTLISSLLKILQAKEINVILAAPTGRAAKKMSEATGHSASTIHRLLRRKPGEEETTDAKLECDLLVLDEVSMIDVLLMHAVLKSLPLGSSLILVGDTDQLPSIGPGSVLADLINSKTVPVIHLTEIFRQGLKSQIVYNAHRINQGLMPILDNDFQDNDFFFFAAETPEEARDKIIELTQNWLPENFAVSTADMQLLCPMTRGVIGSSTLNIELQRILNNEPVATIQILGMTLKTGDKVMQTENNYDREVYNGDIGIISAIDKEEQQVTIIFDHRELVYAFADLDEIVLSYAITIHKSQGSEYPVVIIPIMTQHYRMLQRNLLYTAITRGKSLVVIVGQKKALAMAVKNSGSVFRYSSLKKKLIEQQELH